MTPRLGSELWSANDLLGRFLVLALGQVLASVFGLLFWVVVGHHYTAEISGILVTVASVSSLVSVLSMLGYQTSLVRFLPSEPRDAASRQEIVNFALTRNVLTSTIMGVIGLVLVYFTVEEFQASENAGLVLIISLVVVTSIASNTLLDSVFVGALRPGYVTGRVLVLGSSRILLLIAFNALGLIGLLMAYTIPVVALIAITIVLLMPITITGYRYRFLVRLDAEMETFHRYSMPSYPGAVLSSVSVAYFPLVVAVLSGASDSAIFYVAWSIGSVIFIVPSAITVVLLAMSSERTDRFESLSKRVTVIGLCSIVACIVALLLLGRELLGLFGTLVSPDSFLTLILVAISGIPMLFSKRDISELRLRGILRPVVLINGVLTALSLGLSVPFLAVFGIQGVAYAWLVSVSGAAILARFYARSLPR